MKKNTTTKRYAAFLRGINVGGHKKVPMAELKRVLEGMGFEDVKTVLASGNAVFDAPKGNVNTLRKSIKNRLGEAFGFAIPTLVREMSDIEKMVASDQFKGIVVTKETRLYVTLLAQKAKGGFDVPYVSPDGSFRILDVTDGAVFSVLTVTKTRSVDAMSVIEKEFGKDVTTRNWNTILKVCGL